MTGVESGDILRTMVLGQGFFLVGFSIAIMLEARKFRMPPPHVWAISVSYILLVVGYMTEILSRFGEPTAWRTFLALVSFTFGVYSMWLMYRAYRYAARLERHKQRAITEGNRLMRETFLGGHADDE